MSLTIKSFGEKAHRFIMRPPEQDRKYTLLEGSVRSSKTFAVDAKLIVHLCAYKVDGKRIICGASKQTVYKNMLLDIFEIVGKDNYQYNQQTGELRIFDCRWFVIGAKDEGSERNLRGMTVGIAVLDEWTLFPESFTMQLFLRMSPAGARLYATTNPDNPFHYLRTLVIDNPNFASDLEVIHFTLDDNPNISAESRRTIEASQTGVFHKRYILGLWVIAEGSIYGSCFTDNLLYDEDWLQANKPGLRNQGGHVARYTFCDYGTTNQMVYLDVIDDGHTIWFDNEYVWDSRVESRSKSDDEYLADLLKFHEGKRDPEVVIDPSAASFKVLLSQNGIWHSDGVNDVLDGIRKFSTLMVQGKVRFHRRCKNLTAQISTYAWDDKAAQRGEEKPVKKADHGPDAARIGIAAKVEDWRLLTA